MVIHHGDNEGTWWKVLCCASFVWWEKNNISCFSHTVCLSVVKLGCKVYADHCHFIWSIFISLLSFTHVCLNTHTHTHTTNIAVTFCYMYVYVYAFVEVVEVNVCFKSVLNCLEADLLEVVNTSLLSGTFPNSPKTAVVKPLLKKRNLDNTMLSTYRPI